MQKKEGDLPTAGIDWPLLITYFISFVLLASIHPLLLLFWKDLSDAEVELKNLESWFEDFNENALHQGF